MSHEAVRSALLELQEKVMDALRAVEPSQLTVADIPRWIEIGVRLERQARGLDDQHDGARAAYLAVLIDLIERSEPRG